jgi:hypothetical protein
VKPRIGQQPPHLTQPKIKGVRVDPFLSFGFKHFRQIEWFGLTGTSSSWCASLLERLAALSSQRWDDLVEPKRAQAYRFHEINWEANSIPIARTDINWLPPDYLASPDDYPFYQFHISRAVGRFMGFRDEKDIFQIVLVDPLHNLQPSKDFGYRVRPSDPLRSDYDMLRAQIDGSLQAAKCTRESCETLIQLQNHSFDGLGILTMKVEGSDLESAQALIANGTCTSLYKVFQEGLLCLMVKQEATTGASSLAHAFSDTDQNAALSPPLPVNSL